MGYMRVKHRCPLPFIRGHGDIWQCDECSKVYRSHAPGNPNYECWRRLGWLGRLVWARGV